MPAASQTKIQIGEDQVRFYKDQGYLVLKSALSANEVEELRQETIRIARGDSEKQMRGVEPAGKEVGDDEAQRRYLCIHQPHKFSSCFHGYLSHPAIVEVLSKVISPNVKCMQSMLFIKAAGKPGQAWHQDEDYIPTRDRSLAGAWMAMDDATIDNGCLWVIPGSHRHGVLWPQAWHGDKRFDCALEARNFPYKDEDAIPVEVPAGSIVFFNGYLLHRSLPNNRTTGFRRALVNHYMSAESLLPWQEVKEGESVAIADFRDVVIICGKDPYAWKGYDNIIEAHIRPDGKGGCGNNEYNKRQD
jgi:ectoine hydroxylase-related dioxygenase (phytanoyl-CoA dioxygenase family)